MKEAMYWKSLENKQIRCILCPHNCVINDGKVGICKVRKNVNGILYTENYELVTALNLDPIEKKPLFHFYPGKKILSLGSVGCNMKCNFCQNWSISQCSAESFKKKKILSLSKIINFASNSVESVGVAFTYNEPTVWYEYMLDLAKFAKQNKLKTVMVSNGYINKEPLEELLSYIDAFSIDLKAFNDNFYSTITKSSLEPVLETLKLINANNKHLEIDFLVIPGLNDGIEEFRKMVNWISNNLGEDCIFHINRYFPAYKSDIPATPEETIVQLYKEAKNKLNYVYIGNMKSEDGAITYCPECGIKIIIRNAYDVRIKGIDNEGKCIKCGKLILKDYK